MHQVNEKKKMELFYPARNASSSYKLSPNNDVIMSNNKYSWNPFCFFF